MPSNYIYAKVKRKQNLFRVIETDTNIYDSVPILTGVEYAPSTLIEDQEMYRLSNFSSTIFAIDFIKSELDSVNFNQISKPDLRKISFLCTVQNGIYFFQVINSNYYISKKWFSIDELSLEVDKPIITINPSADAIYDKQNDVLFFRKLSVANRIFKGMDQLYREATDDETSSFLGSDFLNVSSDFNKDKVSIPNRKRIALVSEVLSRFSDAEKQSIYDYTNQYGQVSFDNGRFNVETDDQLKFVLWGIEQRFYTTPISGEKRVANSIISIS